MPFPFAAAAAGIGLASELFKKKPKTPVMPNFFVNNPDELRALIRQSTQSQYAGLTSTLRENLSNAGVLSPSSLADATTRASIGLGQETLGKFSDIGIQELERARALQSQDYLTRLEDTLSGARQDTQNTYAALGGLGKGLGDIYGQGKDQQEEDPLNQILNSTKKKKTAKPGQPGEGGDAIYG
jgi:hypothetical protein